MNKDLKPESDRLISRLRAESILQRILTIRGHSVILDLDLAALYRVTTRALNQAVKRNAGRFPEDFAFRITTKEKEEVVTKCDHLSRLKFSPVLPFAYTEHGTIMAASVLNSLRASKQVFSSFALSSACAKRWHPIRNWRTAWTNSKRRTTRVSVSCSTQFEP